MAINYTLKDKESIEAKVTFLRIAPNGKRQTLDDIFTKLSDLSWINRMTPPALHKSFEIRAKRTLDKLVEIINNSATLPIVDAVVTDAAEYIVSVLAQEAVVCELGYRDIPLPEIYKQQKSQNPGFDFIVVNARDVVLFGEAKFETGNNAYGSDLSQIVRFIAEQNDIADLVELYVLIPKQVDKVNQGEKGFVAAFSSTNLKTERLIKNIQRNVNYDVAKGYDELILVAVDML